MASSFDQVIKVSILFEAGEIKNPVYLSTNRV